MTDRRELHNFVIWQRELNIYIHLCFTPSQPVQLYQGDWQKGDPQNVYMWQREVCSRSFKYMNDRENETAELLIIIKVFVNGKILSVETILSA